MYALRAAKFVERVGGIVFGAHPALFRDHRALGIEKPLRLEIRHPVRFQADRARRDGRD